MDDETETRIVETAEYIHEAVSVLERKQSLTKAAYLEDREQRAIVEREFQTAIEACLDIAARCIKASDTAVPETNAQRFAVLEDLGVLTTEAATAMQEAAGFRNVLAHRYGHDIDDERVYWHLQHDLDWFRTYLSAVRSSLDEPS